MTFVVFGGSGFVGSAIVIELSGHGPVTEVAAPRLTTSARNLSDLLQVEARLDPVGRGTQVVVNAAGMATPGSADTDDLWGANALLPLVLAREAAQVGARLVHLSSAAVLGRTPELHEEPRWAPLSPYAQSKALGEQALLHSGGDITILRATSVHGPGRATTDALARFARSRWAAVAAPGLDPTPQVHVSKVASAVRVLALADAPPRIALQPWEGMTTERVLAQLGGHQPTRLPRPAARAVTKAAGLAAVSSRRGSLVAHTRRLEMLLFGQRQVPGWLDEHAPDLRIPSPQWKDISR